MLEIFNYLVQFHNGYIVHPIGSNSTELQTWSTMIVYNICELLGTQQLYAHCTQGCVPRYDHNQLRHIYMNPEP
jgi:hypothetical protein